MTNTRVGFDSPLMTMQKWQARAPMADSSATERKSMLQTLTDEQVLRVKNGYDCLMTQLRWHCERGRICLDNLLDVEREQLISFAMLIDAEQEPHLPDDCDLVGFSLEQFRTFFAGLRGVGYRVPRS
ncbi:MAG: hypothetical protein R3C10_02305 [Pirellulales bacterium]